MSDVKNECELAEDMEDRAIHPGVRSFVTTDAEFRVRVQRGRDSARVGPNRDFEAVDAEIRRSLLAP